MKVFYRTSSSPHRRPLNKENITISKILTKSEKEILMMIYNWGKVGFAVECAKQQKSDGNTMQYDIILTGSDGDEQRCNILIGSVVKPENGEYNSSHVAQSIEEFIRVFFSIVEVVRKQNSE